MRRRATRWPLLASSAVVLVLLLLAASAPLVAPYDPAYPFLEQRLDGPSMTHPFGFDELGRDVFSRVIWGARVSIAVGLSVVLLAGLLGTAIGVASGWAGGLWDSAAMRLADAVLAFPGILLAIGLVAVLGPALEHLVLALVAVGWVGYARLARSLVLALRERPFVDAAIAAGARPRRILILHVLPNVLPPLVVQSTLGMAGAILAEASLSFLGLGIQAPTPSWGGMVDAGRLHLLDAPHVALFPGVAIFVTVMSLNLLGDGLVDRLGS